MVTEYYFSPVITNATRQLIELETTREPTNSLAVRQSLRGYPAGVGAGVVGASDTEIWNETAAPAVTVTAIDALRAPEVAVTVIDPVWDAVPVALKPSDDGVSVRIVVSLDVHDTGPGSVAELPTASTILMIWNSSAEPSGN